MGSGKTHWGKLLSDKLAIPFFDLDEEVVNHAGKSIVSIFAEHGEETFRSIEKEVLEKITTDHTKFIVACGGGTPCYFSNIDFMNLHGTTVWINTPIDILFERLISQKDNRPLIKDLSDEQLKNFISKKFADRKMYYDQASVTVDEEPVRLEHLIETSLHAE